MDENKIWDLYNKYIKTKVTLKGAGVQPNSATVFELATKYYENSQHNDDFKKLMTNYTMHGFDLPNDDFEQASFIIALSAFSFTLI